MYLIILLFFFFNMVCFDWLKYGRNKNIIYYFEMIILILVAGFRYKLGGDTFVYMVEEWPFYPTLSEITKKSLFANGHNIFWNLTIIICKTLCHSFIFFQFVHTIFVNLVFFWFFKKYTPYIFSAVFVYAIGHFFYFNFEIMREIICICILMMATPALLEKKYLKYYVYAFIALGFHYSSIFIFTFPILLFFKPWGLKSSSIFSLSLFCIVSCSFVLISSIFVFLNNSVITHKFLYYTSEVSYSVVGIAYQMFLCLPVALLLFLNQRYNTSTSSFNNLLSMLMALYLLTITLGLIAIRLCNYIIPFYLIFGINIFYKVFSQTKRPLMVRPIIFSAIFCIFFNFGYYYFKKLDVAPSKRFYTIFYPYTSIWSDNNTSIIKARERYISKCHSHWTEVKEEVEQQ